MEKRRYKRIKRAVEQQESEEEKKPAVETFDSLKEKLGAVYQEQVDMAAELREWDEKEGMLVNPQGLLQRLA